MRCPLCHAETAELPVVQTPTWRVLACTHCTNGFTDPAPGAVNYEAENFHAHVAANDNALPPQWRQSLQMQVALLKSHVPARARVLEIGCGQGLLLAELKKHSFAVAGIEPSATASEQARQRELNVATGYFPHPALPDRFDCVIMSHVLEHVPDPLALLRQVAAITPRLFFVQTHLWGVMPQRLKEKWYAWLPEQHFWHFSPRGLQTLLSPIGFTTTAVEYSSLVHTRPDGTINKFSELATATPSGGDQFHLLLTAPCTST